MSRSYHVMTEKFGTVSLVASSIEEARRRAKLAFGAGPDAVTRAPAIGDRCPGCDSTPCACEGP